MKPAMAGQHLQGLCCIAVEDCQSYTQQSHCHKRLPVMQTKGSCLPPHWALWFHLLRLLLTVESLKTPVALCFQLLKQHNDNGQHTSFTSKCD